MDDQINYTTINHTARKKLGLTILEYCLGDLIYNLSSNPKSVFPGWCYASKPKMAKMIESSEREVFRMINVLLEKKLIEKNPDTKYLRTTELWYDTVIMKTARMSGVVTNWQGKDDKLAVDGGDKLAGNKDNIDKDNNNLPTVNRAGALENGILVDKIPNGSVLKVGGGRKGSNRDIDFLMDYFLKTFDIPVMDGSVMENRRYCWLLLKKHGPAEKIKFLIDIAKKNNFWSTKITSFNILYHRAVAIINETRSRGKFSAVQL